MYEFIRKLILKQYANTDTYIEYLKSKGAIIGSDVIFLSPNKKPVDEGRIKNFFCGNNVVFCDGVKIIMHDYSWENLRKSHNEILPNWGGKVKIGNNVFIGVNTIILKDCKIGDNVIIGAGSVVQKSVPDNCVCAGNPCRIICTMDEYYKKRKNSLINEAVLMYKEIKKNKGDIPTVEEMAWFSYLFLSIQERKVYFQKLKAIGDNREQVYNAFISGKQLFENYEEFVIFAEKSEHNYEYKTPLKK